MGRHGVPENITAGILGHSHGRGVQENAKPHVVPLSHQAVTSRYALAQHMAERRRALQAWADWLDSLRRSSFKVAGGRA